MADLVAQRCVACRPDAPPVTAEQISEFKPLVPLWEIVREEGIPKLERSFAFKDFAKALAFTNEIGAIAEEEGHHPRLITEWGGVRVAWWSHEIKNLHVNDFIMSAKTDRVFEAMAAAPKD